MPKMPDQSKPRVTWKRMAQVVFWTSVFGGIAWGGVEAHSFVMHDPRFGLGCSASDANCATLEIHGAVHVNQARIRSVFAQDYGHSVFSIPLAERRRHLLAVDWVHTASVTRIWPNRISVTIAERAPVAFARLPIEGSSRHWLALIDQEGVLMSIPQKVRFRLPVLSGVTEDQTDEQRRERVKAMQHLLDDLGPQAKEISEVNAAVPEDLRVIADMDGQAYELLLGDQHFRARYLNFQKHYQEIRAHAQRAAVFDLRMDDRILVH